MDLVTALHDPEHCAIMPPKSIEKEYDRFKIWAGNLGAQQAGRSSLDFRLRESTVVCTNVLMLMGKLRRTLAMSELISVEELLVFVLGFVPKVIFHCLYLFDTTKWRIWEKRKRKKCYRFIIIANY